MEFMRDNVDRCIDESMYRFVVRLTDDITDDDNEIAPSKLFERRSASI